MPLTAGVARSCITPYRGVELTGWGYYLQRRWQRIHDHLSATALALENAGEAVVLISVDLMVISEAFTRQVRRLIEAETDVPAGSVLVAATHTHNAPASGGLLGVGEVDPFYEDWAARQAATAAILAWQQREPATVAAATGELPDITYNRTREAGPVDPTLTTLRVDRADGKASGGTLAMVVNYQGHPVVSTLLRGFDVSRDAPGEVCDHIEAALPGCTCLYLQGACGDVNFLPEFSTPAHCAEPARRIADLALAMQDDAAPSDFRGLAAVHERIELPTRRWTRDEIDGYRDEAQRRLATRDTTGWRETFGRAMTNNPDDMVARHGGDEWKAVEAMCRFHVTWTTEILKDYDTRPMVVETEVQAVRIGDMVVVTNACEFFTTLALDVRERSDAAQLMITCYANGRIGYLPDAHDIALKTYAAYQSPKYCLQHPFVDESGLVMCDAMVKSIERV